MRVEKNPRRRVPVIKVTTEKRKIARKRKPPADAAKRKRQYKNKKYKERAKRLRPFFKDNFEAAEGFDLRSPDSWTPAQKAKVTKYFRVMAPHITGDYVVKRYRRPDTKQAAFDASLQEKKLTGQTAIAFKRTDPREKLEIQMTKVRNKKGKLVPKVQITQSGIKRIKIEFNRDEFLKDPDAEIDRALAATNANVFRIIAGGSTQLKALTRADVKLELAALMKQYAPSAVRRKQGQRPFEDWLNGLIAYPGSKAQTLTAVEKFVKRQERTSAKSEIERLNQLSIDRGGKGYNRTVDAQIKIRRKRKGL